MTDQHQSSDNGIMETLGRVTTKLVGERGTTIPVVRLHGSISAEQRPGRINIESAGPVLEKAFEIKSAPAVAIIINSPGGSPVQSRLVSKRIRDLANQHEKQVLVFVEDVAASGGYFIAVAGDEIFADPSSVVGSIGVIMATFGFEEAIRKLGVTRRVYTAGKNKNMLDPFLPENAEDVDRIKAYELDIHQVFIDWVKTHRGDKLTQDEDIFTGEFWTAKRGLELGLIDAIGDVHEVLRRKFGDDVRLKKVQPRKKLFALPGGLGMSTVLRGDGLASGVVADLEERALWGRYGL